MRVLITGGTGLIGQEIIKQCHASRIDVNYLTTDKSKIKTEENYEGFYWNPGKGDIDVNCFKNVDAIINLAGAPLSKRWTAAYKSVILSSRKKSSQLLVNSLMGESHTIKHVISASAIGIYPDSLTNYYDESFNGIDDSFLSEVVSSWEQAINEFSILNIAVSKIRTGLVLSNKGGVLPEIIKPIKYGFGASFGTGKQWQSWIHIKDLASLFLYVLKHQLVGVYNGVAPNAVTNQELTKTIAKVLNSSLLLPNIPRILMKLILGEMHGLLYFSQRVSSKKIENKGFYFKYHHLEPALVDLLN